MAAPHSSDSDELNAKKERKRLASRLYYHLKKQSDPDFNKKRYARDKQANPNINKEKYRRALARNPDFNKEKRAKKTGVTKRPANRKPAAWPKSQNQIASDRERNRRKYLANRQKQIAQAVARQRQRYREDPQYAVYIRLRSRIRYAMKLVKAKKFGQYEDLAGCTIQKLREHIESQFVDGMTWDNKHEWHIDHIIPISAFDISTEEGQRAAFHYTNMRPIWAIENRKKHAKPPAPQRRFDFGYVMLADEQRSRREASDGGKGSKTRRRSSLGPDHV